MSHPSVIHSICFPEMEIMKPIHHWRKGRDCKAGNDPTMPRKSFSNNSTSFSTVRLKTRCQYRPFIAHGTNPDHKPTLDRAIGKADSMKKDKTGYSLAEVPVRKDVILNNKRRKKH